MISFNFLGIPVRIAPWFWITMVFIGGGTTMADRQDLINVALFVFAGPWLPCIAVVFLSAIFTWELLFCIILATPIILLFASIGGMVAWISRKLFRRMKGSLMGALVLVTFLPYLTAPFESLFPAKEVIRTVHSSIDIEAPADIVWVHITDFAMVSEAERPFALFRLLGLPRPIEAEMVCEAVGCNRRGVWEDGLAFDGTITGMEPGLSYWVSLAADTNGANMSTAPLHEIGGPMFGMVDDGYEIEVLPDGSVRLHLYSTYRVQTRINVYAVIWLDFLMRDIQRHILQIEKVRSEYNFLGSISGEIGNDLAVTSGFAKSFSDQSSSATIGK